MAWRASDDTIVVACADGWLVELEAASSAPGRAVYVEDDLRDVVVAGDRLLVSRFRSAEVLAIDASGAVTARARPATAERPDPLVAPEAGEVATVVMEPLQGP